MLYLGGIMKQSYYLYKSGRLQRKDNTLEIVYKDNTKKVIPVERVEDIYVMTEFDFNTALLNFLSQYGIKVHFFNYYGFYTGTYYPKETLVSGKLLIKQVEHYTDNEKRVKIAKAFIDSASYNIHRNLVYYKNRGKDLEEYIKEIEYFKNQIDNCKDVNELMGIEGNIRKEETPAHIAVREALINLCVHADYTEDASLVVRHNTNAFVFSNPGTMLVSKEQYYSGGESVCRNKSLQKMFSMLGVAEKAGSGTDKILKGWKESNWRAPIIDEHQNPDKIELIMPMESLLSENTKSRLEEIFGRLVSTLEHDVLSVLALACDEGSVTNERLRYSLNLHKEEIAALLKQMCQKRLLVAQGHGRGMRYYLPEDNHNDLFALTEGFQGDVAPSDNKVISELIGEPLDINRGTSNDNRGTSNDNRGTSNDNRGTSSKKRLSKQQMDSLIISICQDWMDKEEIAQKISRTVKYVSDVILPRMLKEEALEMLYPGIPNHPKQKYKIKD